MKFEAKQRFLLNCTDLYSDEKSDVLTKNFDEYVSFVLFSKDDVYSWYHLVFPYVFYDVGLI